MDGCPIHQVEWKHISAGISKTTGKPYGAFSVCPVKDCKQRPTSLDMREPIDEAISRGPQAKDYVSAVDEVAKRSYRIERQHSQEMALRYIDIKGKSEFTWDELEKLIDKFMEDLDAKSD